MEIVENTKVDYTQQFVDKIITELQSKNRTTLFWSEANFTKQIAIEVGKKFTAKGYYAKVTYFTYPSYKGFQSLTVSKVPLNEFSSCKVYDVML